MIFCCTNVSGKGKYEPLVENYEARLHQLRCMPWEAVLCSSFFPIFLYKREKRMKKKQAKHIDASGMHVDTHAHMIAYVCVSTTPSSPLSPQRLFQGHVCMCVNTSCCPGQSVAIGYHSFKSEDRMNSKTRKNKQTKVHSSFAQHSLTLSHGGYKKNHTHLL